MSSTKGGGTAPWMGLIPEAVADTGELAFGDGPADTVRTSLEGGDALAPGSAADVRIAPGEMLGPNYVVLERLGEGGMGTIYAVEHVRMHKRFAAKVLKSALCTPDNVRRMEREAAAASRVEHENVVRVVNLDEDGAGRLFIISELLAGRDLAVRLRDGPLPPAEAVSVALRVASGLGAAHRAGVIHRDLKPENVFLCDPEGGAPPTVKVLDFGISTLLFGADTERLTAMGSIIGTPRYMSPEHATRRPVDARSDVYSLGILLFEMLTGVTPFSDSKPMKVVMAHLRQTPPPPSVQNDRVPPALDRIVLKCLSKDPEERYPDMEALAQDLRTALADDVPAPAPAQDRPLAPATVPAPDAPPWTPKRRSRGRVWLAVAVTVAVALTALALKLGAGGRGTQAPSRIIVPRAADPASP